MKLFIFGAGASKGAVKNLRGEELLFPETKELFNKDYQFFWQQVYFSNEDIARLKNELGDEDFEKWLTNKWMKIQETPSSRFKESKLREFGRLTLYFWNLFNSLSNAYVEQNEYRKLIESLNRDEVDYGFISFNYDTFLDQALINANGGAVLSTLKDYYKEKLVKPHGSVNWFLTKRSHDRIVERIYDDDIQARFNLMCSQMYDGILFNMEHFISVGPSHHDMQSVKSLINERFEYQYFYPLIFVPMTSKLTNFVESFYLESISQARKLAESAEEIYIIGYKAKDEAIKKVLPYAQEGTTLHVISNTNAEKISSEILKWAPNLRQGSMLNGGFAEFNRLHIRNRNNT
jgi:hypothetical protein